MAYRLGRPGEGGDSGSFVLAGEMERVSWGAIVAGVAAALAVQILLALIGAAAGFAAVGAVEMDDVGTGALIYWAIAGIASLFAGGFVAGRMAGAPLPTAAVLHGVVVWAVVTVASAAMVIAGAAAFVSGASKVAMKLGEGAASAAEEAAEAAPEDFLSSNLSRFVPEETVQEIRSALRERDLTAADIRREAREIAANVVDEQERRRAAEIGQEAARDVLRTPSDIYSDISEALDKLIGAGGVIGEDDRQALVEQLSQRFEVSPEEAGRIADRWISTLQEAGRNADEAVRRLRERGAEFADEAAEEASEAAFWAALATFLGLFGGAAGALLGRPEDLIGVEIAKASAAD